VTGRHLSSVRERRNPKEIKGSIPSNGRFPSPEGGWQLGIDERDDLEIITGPKSLFGGTKKIDIFTTREYSTFAKMKFAGGR
jgi:hypothetical protein